MIRRGRWRSVDVGRLSRLAREGAWVGSGQAAAFVGSLASVYVLTRHLSPDEYGRLALGLTLATLVNQAVMGPIGTVAARLYAPASGSGHVLDFFAALWRLVTRASSAIAILLLAGVAVAWLLGVRGWIVLALLACAYALAAGASSVLANLQSAARERVRVAVLQGLEPWLRLLAAVAFILAGGGLAVLALAGYALASFIVLWVQRRQVRRLLPAGVSTATPTEVAGWRASIGAHARPIATFGVFTWAQLVTDRWALHHFGGDELVGYYVALHQIGYLPVLLATSAGTQFLAPIVFSRAGDGTDAARNRHVTRLNHQVMFVVLAATVFATGLAWLFHAPVMAVMTDDAYARVSYLLPVLTLAGGLFSAGQFLTLDLLSRMESRALAAAKIGTAVVGVALNCVGAAAGGIEGVVAASAAFSLLFFLTVLFLTLRGRRA